MDATRFSLRITVPQNARFDVSFLAVAANNAGYLLSNQKVYVSDKTGETLIYLYFEKKSSAATTTNNITGLQ